MSSSIAVVGLGKLGAPLAAVLAANKTHVIGVDVDQSVVDLVNEGKAPVNETGLDEVAEVAHPWLRATTDITTAVAASSMAFVVVPTPSDSAGRFLNLHVIEAVSAIGAALCDSDKPSYTVAIVSTMMPGSLRGPVRQALEQTSGRECGIDVSLVAAPTFIALGSVIHDLTHPELMLIGCDDEFGARDIRRAYAPILQTEPAWCELPSIDVEIAKIGLNFMVVAKVSAANMFAEICEQAPGANARNVTRAIGNDSRIGSRYFEPGAGVGGPCFPRDAVALLAYGAELGVSLPLARATHQVNANQTGRIAAKVADEKRVAVLGLTYKTGTDVTDESLGTALVKLLEGVGITVAAYDPMVPGALADAISCVAWADAVIVATPWPEFAGLDYSGKRVIDVWGFLPPEENIERIGEHQ